MNVVTPTNLDADAVLDTGKGKIRVESVMETTGVPGSPPTVPEKAWIAVDPATGDMWEWSPSLTTWVALGGGGGGITAIDRPHGTAPAWTLTGGTATEPQRSQVWAEAWGCSSAASAGTNSTALAAAITAAVAGGFELVLPRGSIAINARLVIPAGSTLEIDARQTVITPDVGIAGEWLRLDGNSQVTIRGLTSSRAATAGLNHIRVTTPVTTGGALRLIDCTLSGSEIPIIVDSGTDGVDMGEFELDLKGCKISGSLASGVAVYAANSSDARTLTATGCTFRDIGATTADHAIYAHPQISLAISNCYFVGAMGGYSIQHFGSSALVAARSAVITGCTFQHTAGLGCILTSDQTSSATQINACTFRVLSAQPAVQVRGPVTSVGCAGWAHHGGAIGFSVGNSGANPRATIDAFRWTVVGNLGGSSGSAVSVANGALVVVTGPLWTLNTAASSQHHGLFAGSGSVARIIGGIIEGNAPSGGGAIPVRVNATAPKPNTDVEISGVTFRGNAYGVYGCWVTVEGANGARARMIGCDCSAVDAAAVVYPLRVFGGSTSRTSEVRDCIPDGQYFLAPRSNAAAAWVRYRPIGRDGTAVASASTLGLKLGYAEFSITGTATVNTIQPSAGSVAEQLIACDGAEITLISAAGFTLGTAGNIALSAPVTILTDSVATLRYDASASKWRLL